MGKSDGWWCVYVRDDVGDWWLIAAYSAERYPLGEIEVNHENEDQELEIQHYNTLRRAPFKLKEST